jgi:hypothetical protein
MSYRYLVMTFDHTKSQTRSWAIFLVVGTSVYVNKLACLLKVRLACLFVCMLACLIASSDHEYHVSCIANSRNSVG